MSVVVSRYMVGKMDLPDDFHPLGSDVTTVTPIEGTLWCRVPGCDRRWTMSGGASGFVRAAANRHADAHLAKVCSHRRTKEQTVPRDTSGISENRTKGRVVVTFGRPERYAARETRCAACGTWLSEVRV